MRLKSCTLTIAILFAASGLLAIRAIAQNLQDPSFADAARINRQQKNPAAKPGTVITNDPLNPQPASNAPTATPTPSTASATLSPDASSHATATPDSKASSP